jgi:hypothetical protein
MPIPAILINTGNFGLAWTGQIAVTTTSANPNRATVNKTFHAYVEAYEQSKHDAAMKSFRTSRGLDFRTAKGTQVSPANNNTANPFAYYLNQGQTAAEVVAEEMTRRWEANTTNNTVFVRGQATVLAVQGTEQDDGWYYDVTMWYDVHDVYVAFHCYPG